MKKKPTRAILFFLAALALLVIALSSCEMKSLIEGQNTQAATVFLPTTEATTTTTAATTTKAPATTTVTTTAVTTAAATTTAVSPYRNPLTGLSATAEEARVRPLSFCVGHAASDAIATADIVIEAPTEAVGTRLSLLGISHTALFSTLEIASTRAYLSAINHDFFGISVFCGTSDRGHASIDFLYDGLDLSEVRCESTEASLQKALETAGIQTEHAGEILLPYVQAPQGETILPDGNATSYVSVSFSQTATTSFTYDAVKRQYTMRSSAAMTDGAAYPTFSNLVILFHDATRRITKDGIELTLDTELGGNGFYLTHGRAIPIFWRRDPVTSSLSFTDTNGVRLTVNIGKTYIGMSTYEYRDSLVLN